MKKVVNSVLASALALTVAPMVVGAEEAATTNAPQMDEALAKVVKRLNALGVVQGYGDGDFKVDQTINRAEFATLIVRIRGLEQGAKFAQYQNTFTDVNSADWFAGFVNVASGQEIIKGFPDKSFKPKNEVTYAEAVTMIVRALGYEPATRGVWPNNMIAKASELNIAKSIANPGVAATRGDIFKMLDNALRVKLMEQIEYGTDIRFEVSDKTLLTKYMDVEVRDMEWARSEKLGSDALPIVTNVPVIGLGILKPNEITLNGRNAGLGSTATYKVADGINPNEFAGQHVQVWIKDDSSNTIVWMEGSEDEEVILDRLSTFYLDDVELKDPSKIKDSNLDELEVSLDGNGKTYRFTKDTKVTFNFKPASNVSSILSEIADANSLFSAKIVLDENGDISYIHVIDDTSVNKNVEGTKYGSKVIEKVDADKKKISNLGGGSFSQLEDLDEGKDFLVFRNNQPAKLADLKPMDVYSVYYADGKKGKLLVFATSNVVEGKVDKVTMRTEKDNRLVIGDKTYLFRTGATFSDNANEDVIVLEGDEWDKIRNLDGEEVKLYLDAAGRIRHIETGDNVGARRVKAIVTRNAEFIRGKWEFAVYGQNGKQYEVALKADKIYGKDGKTYEKTNEDKIEEDFVPTKDKNELLLLEVTLDTKGEVEKVKVLDSKVVDAGSNWKNIADEDDEAIVVGRDSYQVTKNTAIFDMTGELTTGRTKQLKSPGVAKFKNIAEKDDLKVFYTIDEDEDVEAIFVVEGKGLNSDTQYGLVLDLNRAGGDDIRLLTKDDNNQVVAKTVKLDDDSEELFSEGIKRGDYIAYSLNSDGEIVVDEVVEVVDQATSLEKFVLTEDLKEAGLHELKVGKVTKVTSTKVTYEYIATDGKKYEDTVTINSKTGYIDAYDLKADDGVDEGDFIILVETDDAGSAYDYILTVASESQFKRDFSRDERDAVEAAFLKKGKQAPGDGDGEDPVDPDLVDLLDEESLHAVAKTSLGAFGAYTVTGKGEPGANVEVVVTVEGKPYRNEKTIGSNGEFKVEVLGRAGATEYTIIVTKEGQETVEETFDFDEVVE